MIVNLANDKNDDWMKKSYKPYRKEEREAFAAALVAHKKKRKK